MCGNEPAELWADITPDDCSFDSIWFYNAIMVVGTLADRTLEASLSVVSGIARPMAGQGSVSDAPFLCVLIAGIPVLRSRPHGVAVLRKLQIALRLVGGQTSQGGSTPEC